MARIVVIGDDSYVVTPLGELLKERGNDTVTCCGAHCAFATLKQEPVDLVILDLRANEPEGGWDILTFLQLHPAFCRTPAIVCSGQTDEIVAKQEWLEDHGIDVLLKPFDLDDLYRHVDTLLKWDDRS